MKKFKRRSARMNIRHFHVLTGRYIRQIVSNLGTLIPLLLEPFAMLLILYLVCEKDAFSLKEAKSITSANVTIFVLVVMAALMGILNSYREICKERDILAREVFGGLDLTAYVMSKSIVLSIVGALQCTILFGGSFSFIDYAFPSPAQAFILCLLALILVNICVTNLGLLVSATLKNSESAILPVLIIIIFQVVFCDCLFELKGGADWIKYITPSTWGIAVFGNACKINDWSPKFNKDLYAMNPWIPILLLFVFSFLLLTLTIVRLKRTYRQKD